MINWNQIDHLLLDMDGTLLDLHFDNHFWLKHVPQRYAEGKGISFVEAEQALHRRYKDIEGTLEWYCVDHWSRELDLDIALLKEEVDHLIAVHPHVVDFLNVMRNLGKQTTLVTNAHQKSLALKMKITKLGEYFDKVISAHDLGLPKEDVNFWGRLQALVPFDKQRTLFVDDSPGVLCSASEYGIRWLIQVLKPDTKALSRKAGQFPAIQDFSEILP